MKLVSAFVRRAARQAAALSLALGAAAAARAAQPAVAAEVPPPLRPTPEYRFDEGDAVRGRLGAVKPVYYVGEPLVIPIVLINHMKYPIKLMTNFNPRGNLSVSIQRNNQVPEPYYAHYRPAVYGPLQFELRPMEEISHRLLIWADANRPTGLALDEPGTYTIRIGIRLEVPEARLRTEAQFPPVIVRVDPTPPEWAPLVEELASWRGFVDVQGKQLPAGREERVMELIHQYPSTPLTPYLCYAAANYLLARYNRDPEDQTLADRMLYYLQLASIPPTSFQVEALMALMSACDQLGLARPAQETAKRLLRVMPRDLTGVIGNSSLLQKYLINTKELDPERYWTVLDDRPVRP